MALTIKQNSQNWAYDLDVNVLDNGEIQDVNVINRSIEAILSTSHGERLFNPAFGSDLSLRLFDGMTQGRCENILDTAINDIKTWEDRISIIENQAKIIVNLDNNSIILIIPYVIKRSGYSSIFKKKILVAE